MSQETSPPEAPKLQPHQHVIDEEISEIQKVVNDLKTSYEKLTKGNETAMMDLNYKISALTSAANRLKGLRYIMSNLQNPF